MPFSLSAFQDQPATHPKCCAKQLSLVTCLPFLPTNLRCLGGKPLLARRLGPILFMQVPNALLCRHRGHPRAWVSPQTVITPHRNHRILAAASGAEEWKFFFFGPSPLILPHRIDSICANLLITPSGDLKRDARVLFFSGGPSAWRCSVPLRHWAYCTPSFICF